jgi:hypothetical protein
MATPTTKTELLKMAENELVKQYQELDSQGRPSKIYTAPVIAVTGTPCLVTELIYQDATSTLILGKKEGYASWDETWIPDSAFTVDYK